jgi:hypothetical protein
VEKKKPTLNENKERKVVKVLQQSESKNDLSYLEETENNLKLFEEKLKKFQESSKAFGNNMRNDNSSQEINYNIYNTNPNSNSKSPTPSTNNPYKLHDRLSEKRRQFKATHSMNNLHSKEEFQNNVNSGRSHNEFQQEKENLDQKQKEEIEDLRQVITEFKKNMADQETLFKESENKNTNQANEIIQLNLIISVSRILIS